MGLFKRYAIHPAALKRWETFRYVFEKMGFANGRLLVEYPRNWKRMLIDSLYELKDVERKRIVEKLTSCASGRMVRSRLAYDSQLEWAENVEAVLDRARWDRVVVTDETPKRRDPRYATPEDVDEEFFQAARGAHCLATAQDLAAQASPLLHETRKAVFVDPYFVFYRESKKNQKKKMTVLAEMARVAQEGGRCKGFDIFARQDQAPKGGVDEFRLACAEHIEPLVEAGFEVTISLIDAENSKRAFHARYLLGEMGGLRYDKGFEESSPPIEVDVSLLDDALFMHLRRCFMDGEHDFTVENRWVWRCP